MSTCTERSRSMGIGHWALGMGKEEAGASGYRDIYIDIGRSSIFKLGGSPDEKNFTAMHENVM
ncbi:MAG: hypothetical protein RM338_14920 [Nostoc sp. DedQUE12a]|nr:hypothetical protein [Nostoc sp. DedQUE12a]